MCPGNSTPTRSSIQRPCACGDRVSANRWGQVLPNGVLAELAEARILTPAEPSTGKPATHAATTVGEIQELPPGRCCASTANKRLRQLRRSDRVQVVGAGASTYNYPRSLVRPSRSTTSGIRAMSVPCQQTLRMITRQSKSRAANSPFRIFSSLVEDSLIRDESNRSQTTISNGYLGRF